MARILQVAPGQRGAYPAIGEALGDAPDDVIIEVAGGLYREGLYVVGKRVMIRRAEGGLMVRIGAVPTIRTTTISNCGHRGIYIYQFAKPLIEACDISRTVGPGISVALKCEPTIRRCKVHDIEASGISFGRECGGL